jgi:hypothetical protein
VNVRFFAGTKEQYLKLATYNPLALYFCEDTQELFWADRCLSDGIRVVQTYDDLPEISKAADGLVYYVTETRNGYTLSPDRTKWLQTIYAPATNAYEVPEEDLHNTVTTVGAVRDIEKALYTYIDNEIADVNSIKSISFAGMPMTEAAGVFSIDKDSAFKALGIEVPDGVDVNIATDISIDDMATELKAYVAEQLNNITSKLDGGEV